MTKINSIIFDLGGVILNLDQDRTLRAFNRLGVDLVAINEQSSVFKDFEKGLITADDFRQGINTFCANPLSNEQIDFAWNAMLLDLPVHRFNRLITLRKHFNVYLLSNTNSIHIDAFHDYLKQHHAEVKWFDLFDKVYYSYEMGMRKPDTEIYEFVLKDMNKNGEECIFIDDTKQNLHGAAQVGIHTIWAKQPLDDEMMMEIKRCASSQKNISI